jgi:hypothetical protein
MQVPSAVEISTVSEEQKIIEEESADLQRRIVQTRIDYRNRNAERALYFLEILLLSPNVIDSCDEFVKGLMPEIESLASQWRNKVKIQMCDEFGLDGEIDQQVRSLVGQDCSELELKIYDNLKLSSKVMFERIRKSNQRICALKKLLSTEPMNGENGHLIGSMQRKHEEDTLSAKDACKKNLEMAVLICTNTR